MLRIQKNILILILIIALSILSINIPLTLSQKEEVSVYTETPPQIDGKVSLDEWGEAVKITVRPKVWVKGEPPIGYLMIQNDQEYLYILLDVTQDTEINYVKTAGYEFPDLFYLAFDVDQNSEPTEGVDLLFVPDFLEGRLQAKSACLKLLWGVSEPIKSRSYYAVGFDKTFNEETPHVFWEIAISLEEISPPGNGVTPAISSFGVMIFSPNPYIQLSFPPWMPSPGNFDFTQLITIIIAPPPPVFEVSNLIISPDPVTVDEEVTITVTVSNTGGSSGSYVVSLKVNGELKESKEITLNVGESKTVTFKFVAEQEGTINVEINGLTGSFTVNPPPAIFEVSELSISSTTITVGEKVTISVKVTNTGGSPDSYTVTLKVNGEVENSRDVTLNAGESTTVTFEYTAEREGTFSVDVNGLTGSFTANPPPAFPIPMEMILAAVGGIAAVAVVLFLKMRKPKEKTPEPTAIRLTTDPKEILGDGKSTSTLKIELIDDEGKLIPAPRDIEVKLTSTLGNVTDRIVIPKGSTTGVATLTSSTEFGSVKVTADARGLKSGSTELTFIEKKRYCMHCGARMPLDAEVCPKCGRMPPSGVDVKVCKNCGAIIPVVAKFCSDCGASQT